MTTLATPPACIGCGQPSLWRRYGRCSLCCGYRPMPRGICAHCKQDRAIQARGLCSTCSRTPAIRDQYIAKHKGGRPAGSEADFYRPAPLPPTPTSALPGSKEKIEIMTRRVECGFQACHPEDAKEDRR